jgi:AbrB family looped-hinge helix DNA binding protein
MPVSKLGQRRQVVIPKTVWDDLGLVAGDFVEVERVARTVVIKPKKLVDADDMLTHEEERAVRRGEEQIRQGEYVTLKQLENAVERPALKRRGKTTRKGAA